ncbi:MAG TPA: flavin reductase family protein [Thermoanaerobacterales bacterium]|nr:flavin reductase family protein [Thermoanaerobacterales bacterium]
MLLKEVNIADVAPQILKQIEKGVFLTVKQGDNTNTMTIGWGMLGRIWNRQIFMVLVRYSRYTYELIEKADSFTVSIPKYNTLEDALNICGTKSGRDIDKFKECNLTCEPGKTVASPIIAECDIHVECKIIYKQPLDPEKIPEEIKKVHYKTQDYHVLYYGEIQKTFVRE